MKLLKINGYLHKYASTADRGLNLQFITQELNGEDSAKVQELLKIPCALIFGDQDELHDLFKILEQAEEVRKSNSSEEIDEFD
jgi:hypothetical protein